MESQKSYSKRASTTTTASKTNATAHFPPNRKQLLNERTNRTLQCTELYCNRFDFVLAARERQTCRPSPNHKQSGRKQHAALQYGNVPLCGCLRDRDATINTLKCVHIHCSTARSMRLYDIYMWPKMLYSTSLQQQPNIIMWSAFTACTRAKRDEKSWLDMA